ncbi:IRF3 isoform 28, partial [Pongo abelii]
HGLRQDAQQEDFGIFQVRARTWDAGNPELRAGRKGLLVGRAEKAEVAREGRASANAGLGRGHWCIRSREG